MAISPDEFWDSEPAHPPLTDALVAAAEAHLGVKLPAEYVALLWMQNGGYTPGFVHSLEEETRYADGEVALSELAGIGTDPEAASDLDIFLSPYLIKEWGLPPRQVLLAGDGHTWISLDYRHGEAPQVVWLESDSGAVATIAPSFAEFLAGLELEGDYDDDDEDEENDDE